MGATQSDLSHLDQQTIVIDKKLGIRRNANFPALTHPSDDLCTLYDIFQSTVLNFGDSPYLGTRNQEGGYDFLTYRETNDLATRVGTFLREVCNVAEGEPACIFAKNRAEWIISREACNSYNIPSVALYSTLGPDSTRYIISHCEAKVVICSSFTLSQVVSSVDSDENSLPGMKHIIFMDTPTQEESASLRRLREAGKQVHSFADITSGKVGPAEPTPHTPGARHDIGVIMYTSGTTGDPKGVVLENNSFVCMMESTDDVGIVLLPSDRHFSFLPLAHVFERLITAKVSFAGGRICFYRSVPTLAEDMLAVKPTIMGAAPRLLQRFYDKVLAQARETGGVKYWMLQTALAAKTAALAVGQTTPYWDKIVFQGIAAKIFGGEMRFILTGSAPMSKEVLSFMRCVACCPVVQGYGLTESCAGTSIQDSLCPALDVVGPPLASSEIRLRDIPDLEYFSTDELPRGEIMLRGPGLFKGYYKDPVRTAQAVDEDGWFATGDVGRWNANGSLSIIDRVKNIGKLSQGEYVAPTMLEDLYSTSPLVGQIYIHVDSTQSYLVAIINPDPEVVLDYCQKNSFKDLTTLEAVSSSPEFLKHLLAELEAIRKVSGHPGFMRVKNAHLISEPFTVENDCMTPTFKNKNKVIKKLYAEEITSLYVY